jgi:hypothetical protein
MNWGKIKVGFWSAIGGAIVIAVIGFKWGGWVTSGTAQIIAEEAVVDRLALICVVQFSQDSQKDQKLKELKKAGSWERDSYVEKQGWATMPGEKKPNSEVADECVERLMEIGSKGTEG